jgi:hypothetical protein
MVSEIPGEKRRHAAVSGFSISRFSRGPPAQGPAAAALAEAPALLIPRAYKTRVVAETAWPVMIIRSGHPRGPRGGDRAGQRSLSARPCRLDRSQLRTANHPSRPFAAVVAKESFGSRWTEGSADSSNKPIQPESHALFAACVL